MKRLAVLVAVLLAVTPAWALTGEDFANKMNTGQQNGYATGSAEIAAHLFRRMGDAPRADCIIQWISTTGSVRDVMFAMEKNLSAPAAAVMEALFNRKCGDYK